jgi:hypothetical protein
MRSVSRNPLALAAALLVAALGATACGGDPEPSAEPDTGIDAGLDGDADADAPDASDAIVDADAEADSTDVALDLSPDTPADADADACGLACDPAPVFLHEPGGHELSTFPDDFYTVPDDSTVTGLRVRLDETTLPGSEDGPEAELPGVFPALSGLDGFGTTAGAVLRFSRPLDPATLPGGEDSAEPGSPLLFGYLDADGRAVRVPVEVVLTDDDETAILWPMVPLPPATRAFAGLTRAVHGVDGTPIAPNAVAASLLAGSAAPPLDAMAARFVEVSEALVAADAIDSAADVGALTAFTTQSIVEEALAVAADIRAREHTVATRLGCVNRVNYRLCQLTFEAANYRDAERAFAGAPTPTGLYELTVNAYLPLADAGFEAPYPVAIFGHGLSGDRGQAGVLADFSAPSGLAVVSIDAPEHGDHPVRSGDDDLVSVLDFFGVDFVDLIDPAVLRDNWRQAAWDKLSLVDLLMAGLDVDGDETVDLDAGALAYLGVSLGGIMGPELLALAPEIGAAVLVVPGGRVTDIMQFGSYFSVLVNVLRPRNTTEGDVARFWPLLQTAIERGDSANWAPYLLRDRLVEGPPLQLLVGLVLDDEIVPEASNFSLARALRVPHVRPVLRPVGTLPDGGDAPLSGNLEGGGTAGLLQFDQVFRNAAWEPATHDNIGNSTVGAEAWGHFLFTWLDTGTAEIIDPYESLGLEPPGR